MKKTNLTTLLLFTFILICLSVIFVFFYLLQVCINENEIIGFFDSLYIFESGTVLFCVFLSTSVLLCTFSFYKKKINRKILMSFLVASITSILIIYANQ
ncbi:uncharacterized BrkB/YihY/UPF0761 family membrane protein [Dysgonomonas sp. PH5-45]|nr:uncharacterized BrkB/YihY/UPF0761 family membrane protein [Dysgonomonas sp. PH5-45]MDH6387083.1 uncharacterized BrkB/YihY/UPF0761 family membrane protein [Dysgonomonas sp. PH5-37]